MSVISDLSGNVHEPADLRAVPATQPLVWLQRGWDDLVHHPGASLAHGLLVVGLGYVVLIFSSAHVYFLAAAVSGFLLIGPLMATGLCELSRRREQGEGLSFDQSLEGMTRNRPALLHFAAMLLGLSVLWFVVSALILQALFSGAVPTVRETLWGGFLETVSLQQLIVYLAVGGILACLVFVLSVVSVPFIIHRPVSAGQAMRASMEAVRVNLAAMLLWAALIVALTGIGFATLLLGLVVIYPLLGHATWHAYRDLVK